MRSMDLLRGKNPNPFTNYVKKDCYICLVTIVAGQIIVYTEAYEHTKIKITISNSLSGSPATHRPNHGKRTAGRMEAPHYRRTLHGPFRSNARWHALRGHVGSGQRTPPVYRQRYRTSRHLVLGRQYPPNAGPEIPSVRMRMAGKRSQSIWNGPIQPFIMQPAIICTGLSPSKTQSGKGITRRLSSSTTAGSSYMSSTDII